MTTVRHTYPARHLLAFVLGLSLLPSWYAGATGLVSGHYVIRTTYAPVCLNGSYPIVFGSVQTGSVFTVTTNATGQLSGMINIRGPQSAGSGSISLQNNNVTLDCQITGPNPYIGSGEISGSLHGRQFKGDASDPSGVTPFYMDVSTAQTLVVTFDLSVTVNGQGQVTGSGTASSCALDLPVTVSGTSSGGNCSLHIVGTTLPQFAWDASGPATSFGFVASWNAHGYGFTPSGAQLPIFAPNAPALTPYVTSRKNHSLPSGIVNLPEFITCDTPINPGVECRTGGSSGIHQLVILFPKNITLNPPTGTPAVRVSSGVGSVSQFVLNNNEVSVNLTGVANAQTIIVTLSQVSDGPNTADVVVPARFLLGDTTGNGSVNASDVSQTKARSGQVLDYSNFRSDINLNGAINSSDITLIKAQSGNGLLP
jgi:hypothetical protein